MKTPPVSIDVGLWVSTLTPGDLAFLGGAAFGKLAAHLGLTEAQLYAEWAKRAKDDPDCNVVVDK